MACDCMYKNKENCFANNETIQASISSKDRNGFILHRGSRTKIQDKNKNNLVYISANTICVVCFFLMDFFPRRLPFS